MILVKAIDMACDAHRGQTRWQGEPYIVHPMRVMARVAHHGKTFMAVAALHDVVEDTPVELSSIRRLFGQEIANAVDALTKREAEPYPDFVKRSKSNPIARIVKIADIHDNLNGTEKNDSMYGRYKRALKELYEV